MTWPKSFLILLNLVLLHSSRIDAVLHKLAGLFLTVYTGHRKFAVDFGERHLDNRTYRLPGLFGVDRLVGGDDRSGQFHFQVEARSESYKNIIRIL